MSTTYIGDNLGENSEEAEEIKSVKGTDVTVDSSAQDLESAFFAEDNMHSGDLDDEAMHEDTITEENISVPEEKAEKVKPTAPDREEISRKDTGLSVEDAMQAMMEQPFEIVLENLEIKESEFIEACDQLFSKGHFTNIISLMSLDIILRSKKMNNHVDFADYMRRILIDQISQREFETLRQLRQLSYAIIQYGDEDWSEMSVEQKFNKLLEKDEMVITMLLNSSKHFWRISHLMLHPGALDFLARKLQK